MTCGRRRIPTWRTASCATRRAGTCCPKGRGRTRTIDAFPRGGGGAGRLSGEPGLVVIAQVDAAGLDAGADGEGGLCVLSAGPAGLDVRPHLHGTPRWVVGSYAPSSAAASRCDSD